MTNKMMTRNQAVEIFMQDHLTGEDLVTLLRHINAYDGTFKEEEYSLMEDFNDIMKDDSPMDIALAIQHGVFDPNDDYFKVVHYGDSVALISADWDGVVVDAEDLWQDILNYVVYHYKGDTGFDKLDNLIQADEKALFDGNFEEVRPSDALYSA